MNPDRSPNLSDIDSELKSREAELKDKKNLNEEVGSELKDKKSINEEELIENLKQQLILHKIPLEIKIIDKKIKINPINIHCGTIEHKNIQLESIDEKNTDKSVYEVVKDFIYNYEGSYVSSDFAMSLRNVLDAKFNKSWNCFVGEHFYGVCVHEDNFLCQVKFNGLMVVVFKSFVKGI